MASDQPESEVVHTVLGGERDCTERNNDKLARGKEKRHYRILQK